MGIKRKGGVPTPSDISWRRLGRKNLVNRRFNRRILRWIFKLCNVEGERMKYVIGYEGAKEIYGKEVGDPGIFPFESIDMAKKEAVLFAGEPGQKAVIYKLVEEKSEQGN